MLNVYVSVTLISTPKVLRNLFSFTSFYPVILPSPKIVWFPQVHRGKVGLWEGGDKWHNVWAWMSVSRKVQVSLVGQMVKKLGSETWVQSLGWEDPLGKERATHSSILAWKIPQTEEPGGLWPWDCKVSDMTEQLHSLTQEERTIMCENRINSTLLSTPPPPPGHI